MVVQEGVAIPSTRFLLPYGGDVCAFHLDFITTLHIPIIDSFLRISSISSNYACFFMLFFSIPCIIYAGTGSSLCKFLIVDEFLFKLILLNSGHH